MTSFLLNTPQRNCSKILYHIPVYYQTYGTTRERVLSLSSYKRNSEQNWFIKFINSNVQITWFTFILFTCHTINSLYDCITRYLFNTKCAKLMDWFELFIHSFGLSDMLKLNRRCAAGIIYISTSCLPAATAHTQIIFTFPCYYLCRTCSFFFNNNNTRFLLLRNFYCFTVTLMVYKQ